MTYPPVNECDRERIVRLEGEVRRLEAVALEREKQVQLALTAHGKAREPMLTLLYLAIAAVAGFIAAKLGK